MSRSLILNHRQIEVKLARLAWQIAEEYYGSKEIIVIGIEERGNRLAKIISAKLNKISDANIQLVSISIDKDKPLTGIPSWSSPIEIKEKSVVIVDDVLNSGVTVSGVLMEILKQEPKTIKVAVLANRDHKSFPVAADFVGISLATTLKEHIAFVEEKGKMAVYLD